RRLRGPGGRIEHADHVATVRERELERLVQASRLVEGEHQLHGPRPLLKLRGIVTAPAFHPPDELAELPQPAVRHGRTLGGTELAVDLQVLWGDLERSP